MNSETFQCPHSPKVIRYSVQSGLGEIIFLEMCQACRLSSHIRHVIKKEVLDLE